MDRSIHPQSRRDFLKSTALGTSALALTPLAGGCTDNTNVPYDTEAFQSGHSPEGTTSRVFNGPYAGVFLDRIAFPIGGIGAGMVCLEGTGAFSHLSVRNRPQVFNEPAMFAALSINGIENGAKILEGPVPTWKYFGRPGTGNGAAGSTFGLPRFDYASFLARFPFAVIKLHDDDIPLDVTVTGWSPFIPGDADSASLPVGALEYRFKNPTGEQVDAVFSYNTSNIMAIGDEGNTISQMPNGFILRQEGTAENPEREGSFCFFVDADETTVDHCWFRGGWWDPLTVTWKHIRERATEEQDPEQGACPGGSLSVPFTLAPGAERTIRLMMAWYVPKTNLNYPSNEPCEGDACPDEDFYVPWYAGQFGDLSELAQYWRDHYETLREGSVLFRDTFYDTTLPDEVIEAVAANLSILKSPTVLRQTDGRLWCFEGCSDNNGCCSGSCTHVWNYAQAIPHLFPEMERSLRLTEFTASQDDRGHQRFRSALPIRPANHDFHAASDGQLGGIMKMHREWRISGDTEWLRSLWPAVKRSLDYCSRTWDPKGKGILEEPHHNTYDIEFWGPDGMCSSFYLGALAAAVAMGTALDEDVSRYQELFDKGRAYLETELYDGEYFIQRVQTEGLETPDPVAASRDSWTADYSPEAIVLLEQEGPKYQYGTGCLSDGILGCWMAEMCGLGEIVDGEKVQSHLEAVHRYNLKFDLSDHPNPQRPSFALGHEGGLLLCTWPKGNELTLPFVYSNEVWTGIEYQVASHLMLTGQVDKALDIVRVCRARYDGVIRNPFSEIECGHWYARALASYGLLQGLTGVHYDAIDKTLYIDSQVGNNFRSFLSTATGFGIVGLRNGEPFLEMKMGNLDVQHVILSGQEVSMTG